MTAARTIALFKNDITRTITDTVDKMYIVHDGDAIKVLAEVDFRLRQNWGITHAEWIAAQGN